MRKTCLICVRKHLSQAIVLLCESKKDLGYSWHKYIALGHMAEAEDECCEKYPILAGNIRKNRIRIENDEYENVSIWFEDTIKELCIDIEKEEQF